LFVGNAAFGQAGTTSLRGTITDKSGASVPDAKIRLANKGQALEREAFAGNDGGYEFLALPPGMAACRKTNSMRPRGPKIRRASLFGERMRVGIARFGDSAANLAKHNQNAL
jgi:protocatechuate 3,4-dioxygenase beta subunit